MMTKRTVLALSISLAAIACGGSAPAPTNAGSTATAPAAPLKAPGEARVGDRTHCPVSGEEFVVTDSSPKVEYNGKTYYFCCPGCDAKFKANPQKFVGGPPES